MAETHVRRRASASLETVWAVLADQAGMSVWAPVRSVRLEREGDPRPDGVGAIRVVSLPPVTVREQLTDVEPPTRLAYRMLSGAPVRDYVGETILSRVGADTEVAWNVALTPRFPGVAFVVRQGIALLVRGLVAESERRARSKAPMA
jgi:uncharacterized protein YndB with AHSA1/START domain